MLIMINHYVFFLKRPCQELIVYSHFKILTATLLKRDRERESVTRSYAENETRILKQGQFVFQTSRAHELFEIRS